MDLKEFCYLLVNTNSLNDFLFKQELEDFAADFPDEPEPLDAATQEALLEESLADLDLGNLTEISYGEPSISQSALSDLESLVVDLGGVQPAEFAKQEDVVASGEDYEKALQQSYASLESMRPALSVLYDKVDINHIQSLQAKLPHDLKSLGQPLSADDVDNWLASLKDNEAFIALANYVRTLMPNEDDFHLAIERNDVEKVRGWLELFPIGEQQLELAARNRSVKVFSLWLSRYTPTPYGLKSIMFEVIADPRYFEMFYNMLKPDESIAAELLVPSFYNGCEDVVRFLITKSDLNNSTLFPDNLPLVYAIRGQNPELVQLMLDNGADPRAQSKDGTPLEIAESWLPPGHPVLDLLKIRQ